MLEGFWTVHFVGMEGWGKGVVVYIGGRIFGGDSVVMFTGTYDQQGDAVTSKIHVTQIDPQLMGVMGRNEYDLDLAGTLKENKLNLSGNIPGTDLRLKATLHKQSDLPARA